MDFNYYPYCTYNLKNLCFVGEGGALRFKKPNISADLLFVIIAKFIHFMR